MKETRLPDSTVYTHGSTLVYLCGLRGLGKSLLSTFKSLPQFLA